VRNRILTLAGLALFVALATWPAWHALAWSVRPAPTLARPVGATECVAPTAYMRASHMKLLIEWRDRVVRDGVRTYTDRDGRVVTMSLSKTCLGSCHADKTKFCDRCHDYAGVKPTCWDCHEASPPSPSSGAPAAAGGDR
jgi:[DsrC]-trisulfide reductase subunit J